MENTKPKTKTLDYKNPTLSRNKTVIIKDKNKLESSSGESSSDSEPEGNEAGSNLADENMSAGTKTMMSNVPKTAENTAWTQGAMNNLLMKEECP